MSLLSFTMWTDQFLTSSLRKGPSSKNWKNGLFLSLLSEVCVGSLAFRKVRQWIYRGQVALQLIRSVSPRMLSMEMPSHRSLSSHVPLFQPCSPTCNLSPSTHIVLPCGELANPTSTSGNLGRFRKKPSSPGTVLPGCEAQRTAC